MTSVVTKTWLAALAASFLAGAVFVVACSDDSPGDADAATCSCEPPLAGRIQASKTTQAAASSTEVPVRRATCAASASTAEASVSWPSR